MQGKKTQLVKVRSSRNPVLIALITMSLIPLGILGVAMYQSALAAIQAAAFQRVELASDLVANTVSLAYEELAAALDSPPPPKGPAHRTGTATARAGRRGGPRARRPPAAKRIGRDIW